MPISDNKLPDSFSKSAAKREMQSLEKMGKELLSLSESQLATIPLPENVLEAVHFAHTLHSNGAKKRHLKYLGKMIREVDYEAIQVSLTKLKLARKQNTMQFHQIEEWREDLITHGDAALQKFLVTYPDTDRQQARQLIRNAQHDREKNKKSGAEKELFEYIRNIVTTNL